MSESRTVHITRQQPPPEGPVVANYPFQALFDSVSGTTLQIDRYL